MSSTRVRRDDPIGRVVATNIRRLRQREGWSQQQLASRLAPYIGGELSSAAISQWEDGRNPDHSVRRFSISEVWAICRIFEVNLAVLLHPGVLTSGIAYPPDLFGERYSSIWLDCFKGIDTDDSEMWMRIWEWEEAAAQSDGAPVTPETSGEQEFTTDEIDAAIRLLRQVKEQS